MQFRHIAMLVLSGVITMTRSEASPLDEFQWKNRVLVVAAPAGDAAAAAQRRIYEFSEKGMSERQIVLSEALDDSERSRQIRTQLSADGRHFQVFLTSDKPLSADYLFARVDAMPMRQDEVRRARQTGGR